MQCIIMEKHSNQLKLTSKMAAITGWGITWIFCNDTLHKNNNRIHQSMHPFPDHVWPDLIIPKYLIILIKAPTLGKHSVKK